MMVYNSWMETYPFII